MISYMTKIYAMYFHTLASSCVSLLTCVFSSRVEHPEGLHALRPLPLPPSHPRSQDSSPSSGPTDAAVGEGGVRGNAARHSHSSDGLLDHITTPDEEGGVPQGGLWVNGVSGFRGAEPSGALRTTTGHGEGGSGRGRGGRGGGYSDVLLDYVWGKQQQLQRQQSHPSRQPITTQQQMLFSSHPSQQPPGPPPPGRSAHLSDHRRIKVTRTKSCGPFLPLQQSQADTHNPPPVSAIQPDPHPHLLPPRPPQLPPTQDAQLEEATRSLHKALALEGEHHPLHYTQHSSLHEAVCTWSPAGHIVVFDLSCVLSHQTRLVQGQHRKKSHDVEKKLGQCSRSWSEFTSRTLKVS